MFSYIVRRLLMMIPTLFLISLLSFLFINMAPGGPIEQKLQQMRFGGGGGLGGMRASEQVGMSKRVLEDLKKQYGFDKPMHVRYLIWIKNIFTLDFGTSFSTDEPVMEVIASKFPVSLQFGIISTILMYLICIPLGISKAVRNGSHYDSISSFFLFVLYSIPPLMLGILLLVYFAGGSFYQWFPIGELYSDKYDELTTWGKILDRADHFVLPLICYIIGNFTVTSFLMKNSLLDEIKLDYIRTARAKGLSEKVVIYKHALRNALIPIVTGFGGFLGFFLTGSLIIENIFNLDGIGRLGYKAALDRDYNVLMALIFISSLAMILGRLISDFLYVLVDPRIDFK